MRTIFRNEADEGFFRNNGYVVFDLLTEQAVEDIWSFYREGFQSPRSVYPFARSLPYYISIFDEDIAHKKKVDALLSGHVLGKAEELLVDYEVFYSNLMIKFPGDGQIEAHQDFNFVDESEHAAFNLWCPLVDTSGRNGGLFVIPGSHEVFKTQRGPNLPKALTEYNALLQRYATLIPMKKGQAIIFDHKLVHYSPPNATDAVRVAIQAVLKPKEAPALHYAYDGLSKRVHAYRIDKKYILEGNLWENRIETLTRDHSEELIPFPNRSEVIDALLKLRLRRVGASIQSAPPRPMFRQAEIQNSFAQKGYVKLPLLDVDEVRRLREIFAEMIGEEVENTDYGMYISLEEEDPALKALIIEKVSAVILPKLRGQFIDCKPHLGSFLVKAPGANSYTYPHRDWTFVDSPPYCSITVWIALVDTDERNGALGFINGSQRLFDEAVGSPSPYFRTFTQGHEDVFYEYLEFVPLKAGEAVAFDNRAIHGAPPNLGDANRAAVAIGMTPEEAPLYHYFLLPEDCPPGRRRVAKFRVDQQFFHRYSVASLKKLFEKGEAPQYEIESIIEEQFQPFMREEIQRLCELLKLEKNGRKLESSRPAQSGPSGPAARSWRRLAVSLAQYLRGNKFKVKA
jgi:ectoine hydroxylase-related dioxygenase (phytanoyl-CoA dioxygenase family)